MAWPRLPPRPLRAARKGRSRAQEFAHIYNFVFFEQVPSEILIHCEKKFEYLNNNNNKRDFVFISIS
jgi:hypothetical protein